MTHEVDLVFWPAAVRLHDFRGHVKAARAGGFTSMAIAPEVYQLSMEAGISPADLRMMAADAGAPLKYLDSVTDWAPLRTPAECSADLRMRYDVNLDYCFRMAEKLGLTSFLAVAGYDRDRCEFGALVDGFGRLCERAKAAGYWIDLEFMPFWGMPNLSDAWRLIDAVKPSNAGILVDVWHFTKGDFDLQLLDSIPGRYLAGMQIDDGPLRQVGTSLFDDTINYRNFPGEGEMQVVELVSAIAKKGHLRHVGPEVFSLEADRLGPEEAGVRCGETTRDVLRRAAVPYATPQG